MACSSPPKKLPKLVVEFLCLLGITVGHHQDLLQVDRFLAKRLSIRGLEDAFKLVQIGHGSSRRYQGKGIGPARKA